MADSDKNPWTDLQKFETLLYILDTLNPNPEWKKLDNIPHGRNLNTVKKMIQRERARIEKEKGGAAPASKGKDSSSGGGKKPKGAAIKTSTVAGKGGAGANIKKRKAATQEDEGEAEVKKMAAKQAKVGS